MITTIDGFDITRTEDALTLRKPLGVYLLTWLGALPPLCGLGYVVWGEYSERPLGLGRLLFDLFCFTVMALTFCHVAGQIVARRSVVFDRRRDEFRINGRRICALAEITRVELIGDRLDVPMRPLGRVFMLGFRTAQGKRVWLGQAFEKHRGFAPLSAYGRLVAEFTGASSNVPDGVASQSSSGPPSGEHGGHVPPS